MPWVDPRVRGGGIIAFLILINSRGRSPRTRGRQLFALRIILFPGSIPAYAGEAPLCFSTPRRSRVDPRVRGGGPLAVRPPVFFKGRSPRTRGRRGGELAEYGVVGSIPAYAGEAALVPIMAKIVQVDPRVRGGGVCRAGEVLVMSGRSPRTRGRRNLVAAQTPRCGSIPAYAGEADDPP